MTNRRSFLKSASTSAFALPLLARREMAAPPAADDPQYWTKIREQFLLAPDKVFFNNGTIGAMPRVVVEAVSEHLHKMAIDIADWDYKPGAEWIAGYGPFTELRVKAAQLLNAGVKEVALTENVTAAESFVASGLDLAPGAEVLITDQEHSGGRSSWLVAVKRRKVVVKPVRLANPIEGPEQVLEAFRQAITPQTKVIAISHVITGSGAILPVKEICAEARSRGIMTVLDGAQAFGHIPVDVKDIGCDAYVGCFHKWLLAPAGNGFLYLRGDRAPEVWTTIASGNWDNHDDEGMRFTQRGTGSLSLLAGLEAALDFHTSVGPERVQQRIKYLGDYLRDGLRQIPKVSIKSPSANAMNAGITVYGIAGVTGQQLQDEMWTRDRLRPRASGKDYVRHCTHIYNSTAEIDRALRVVRDVAKG